MRTTNSDRLTDDARLANGLSARTDEDLAAAVDRIACRLLEHVSGMEQALTHRTRGPLPSERVAVIQTLLEHHQNGGHRLRSVKLSPELACVIAIQLADYAETIRRRNA